MQNATRDGIICDLCGAAHSSNFTYYSYDIRLWNMTLNYTLSRPPIYSIDLCPACNDIETKIVLSNYNPHAQKCELSGDKLTTPIYYCLVSKIVVSFGTDLVCTKCLTPATGQICSKCGSNDIKIVADTQVDERLLEFKICEAAYKTLTCMVDETHRKIKEQSEELK